MPIYDFKCTDCGEEFEAFIRGTNAAACPSCRGSHLEQLISLFAVDSESTRQAHLSVARAKGKKIARDKAIAEHEQAHNHHD